MHDSPHDNSGGGMSARAHEVRRMFSSIAHRYDFLNHFLSASQDRHWRRASARRMRALMDERRQPLRCILDVCCGTGDLAIAFRKHLQNPSITGLDFSHQMLLKAGDKTNGNLHLVEGDALRMPFADGLFDASAVAFGLRNFSARDTGLAEMARVVRPGGCVAILEFSRPQNRALQQAYGLYLHRVLPRLGGAISGTGAYHYLADTIEAFPSAEEVSRWMRNAGLVEARHESFSGGIVRLHIGVVHG